MDENKIKFLLNEYSSFWTGVHRAEGLLKALEKLPGDMVLEKKIVATAPGLPPTLQNKTVKDRIEEVKKDYQILNARLEVTKEMLEAEPGGKEALQNWVWEEPKE